MAPAAVTTYVEGMVELDAARMWQSLNQQAINAMTSQGGSQQALQQKLDQAKTQGARYDDVAYIGGYPLLGGSQYSFYVVSRTGFSAANAHDQEFFVFTVGANGKILSTQ